MSKYFGFVVFSILVFTSCKIAVTATKRIECNNCTPIDSSNLSCLNGSYNSELWQYIAPFRKRKWYDNTAKVKLTVIGQKRIKSELFMNDTILAVKTVKGKISNECFSVRTKVFPLGLPPFYYIWYSNKIDLAFNNNDNTLYMFIE